LLLQARPQLALRLCKQDAARAARRLSVWTALAAGGEFLLGPTFGALSDAYGRKWLMLLSPAANVLLRTVLIARPTTPALRLEATVTSALLCAGTISTSASIADLAQGRAQAMASAKIGICAGLAFIVGPIGAGILIRRGGPALAFKASALVSVAQLMLVGTQFQESLRRDSTSISSSIRSSSADGSGGGKKSSSYSSSNTTTSNNKDTAKRMIFRGYISPFSFTRLLTSSNRSLRLLTLVGFLQTFCEPKTWNSMTQLYMRVNVGVAPENIGRFFAAFGTAAILSKALTRTILRHYGPAFHTTLSNMTTALAFFCWGANASSTALSVAAPLLMAPLNMDRRAGVNTRASAAATAAGFGKAEHAALFGNLRALAVSFAPLLFGRIYAWANAKPGRRTGLGFWAAALFAVGAEVVHRSVGEVEDVAEQKEKSKLKLQ
jgi:MFS family permease